MSGEGRRLCHFDKPFSIITSEGSRQQGCWYFRASQQLKPGHGQFSLVNRFLSLWEFTRDLNLLNPLLSWQQPLSCPTVCGWCLIIHFSPQVTRLLLFYQSFFFIRLFRPLHLSEMSLMSREREKDCQPDKFDIQSVHERCESFSCRQKVCCLLVNDCVQATRCYRRTRVGR